MIDVQLAAPVLMFTAAVTLGHRLPVRPLPVAAQHAPRSRSASLKNQAGQPSGAKAAARFRDLAGDRADCAGDDAARVGGPLRQEPRQRGACHPRLESGAGRHLRRLAAVERLQAGADPPARGTDHRRTGGAARSGGGHRRARAAAGRQQLGQQRLGRRVRCRTPTPTPTRATTRSCPAISRRSAFRCWPAAKSRRRTASARRRSRW